MELNTRKMRKLAGMTQGQLADSVGVNLSTIGNWERGVTYPDASQVWDCAVALGCTPNDVLGWEEEDCGDERKAEIGALYDSMDDRGRGDLLTIARSLSTASQDGSGDTDIGLDGVA